MTSRTALFAAQMTQPGLGTRPKNLIDGVLTNGTGDTVTLIDPYSEQPLTTFADAGADLAKKACETAQTAQKYWVNSLSAAARGQITLGAPLDEATKIGPISNAHQLKLVTEMIIAGKFEGADIITRDTQPDTGFFAPPPPPPPCAGRTIAPTSREPRSLAPLSPPSNSKMRRKPSPSLTTPILDCQGRSGQWMWVAHTVWPPPCAQARTGSTAAMQFMSHPPWRVAQLRVRTLQRHRCLAWIYGRSKRQAR